MARTEAPLPGGSGSMLKHRLGLLVAPTLVAGAWAPLGSVLLLLAAALAILAVFVDRLRPALLQGASLLSWGCLLALVWHLGSDSFGVRYVWLYSSAELPLAYKLANVWGGDEGTTLMLAAFCSALAARAAGTAGVTAIGARVAALIAAWYALTAVWLGPFSATPAEWLADLPSQGMNAHLVKIWMLLHAPLVLVAYAWILLLVVPSIAALAGALKAWPGAARTQARRGWVVLSAGIGFGMIWAFEDPMYGQIWHWDPVQTAVFAVWCFLSAHLHGLVSWRAVAPGWRWAPATAMLAAIGAALAMAVTRNPILASSHRYVGAQSWISHGALAVLLLLLLIVLLLRSWHRGRAEAGSAAGSAAGPVTGSEARAEVGSAAGPKVIRTSPAGWGLRLAQWGFAGAGLLALVFLAQAFIAVGAELPRAAQDKPFMAMLLNLVHGEERRALRAAFEQWDVNGYGLARSLLAPLALFGLVGGWYFFRRVSIRLAWAALAIALCVAAVTWAYGGLMTHFYAGRGVLSQRIVALLPWLDAILFAGAFLALACAAWVLATLRRQGWQTLSAVLPSATVHIGVALMLWGGLLSTALNTQMEYQVPMADSGDWQQDRDGNAIRLADFKAGPAADGSFGAATAVKAVTAIEYRNAAGVLFTGEARYRDDRPPPARYDGPLRAACEMYDYRYARFVSTPGYILEPAINHAWSSAMQVWVSPAAAMTSSIASPVTSETPGGLGSEIAPLTAPAGSGAVSAPATVGVTEASLSEGPFATVLVKVFPFASLLWLGLILAVLGGAWLAFAPQRGGR